MSDAKAPKPVGKAGWDMDPQRHLSTRLGEILLKDDLPNVLYHYTTADGLAGILRSRRIRATDVRFLNDSAEFIYALRLIDAQIDAIKTKVDTTLVDAWKRAFRMVPSMRFYAASFSSDKDSLPQWRAYARPYGFALGLDMGHVVAVSDVPKETAIPYRCLYDVGQQEEMVKYGLQYLSDEYERRKATSPAPDLHEQFAAHFLSHALGLAACFKHPAFKEENEWRVVLRVFVGEGGGIKRKARLGTRTLVPYVELPIGLEEGPLSVFRIVIGPTPDKGAAKEGLDGLLEETNTQVRDFEFSEIPFRDW